MKYLLTGQETERLKFRLLQDSDYNTWINLFRGTDYARFLGMAHLQTPEEQCNLWFEKVKTRYGNDRGGMNVLIDKHTGELVGQCGLQVQDVDGDTIIEVGYSLLPQHHGKGYAIEAAKKCRDYAFEQGYADELFSIIHIENQPSVEVALRNGMRLYKATEFLGMPVNLYRITKEEWTEIKNKNS